MLDVDEAPPHIDPLTHLFSKANRPLFDGFADVLSSMVIIIDHQRPHHFENHRHHCKSEFADHNHHLPSNMDVVIVLIVFTSRIIHRLTHALN